MDKKLNARDCLRVMKSLLQDSEDMLELPRGTLDGDFERITVASKSRGIEQVLLVSLPDLCSELENSLERGFYEDKSGRNLWTSNGHPTIFISIYSLIFDADWVLLDGPHVEAIRILRTILKVFKKFRIDCPDSAVKEKNQ
jgi:hypothetical protein